MNPEAQRIAIAEACGWERWSKSGKVVLFLCKNAIQRSDLLEYGAIRTTEPVNWWNTKEPVPDYLNDLNAMHEAEKTALHGKAHESAQTELEEKFRDNLARIMRCAWYQSAKLVHATASQRAEAFLRTLNLWTN